MLRALLELLGLKGKRSSLVRVGALILAAMLVLALSGSQSVLAESDMSSEEIYGSSDPSSEEASGSAVGDLVPIENLYVERWSPADAPGPSGPGTSLASRVKTVSTPSGASKYVYMLQGGSARFWRWETETKEWVEHADTPAAVSDGAALVVAGAYIYAFRGGNYTDFWRYDNYNGWNVPMSSAPNPVGSGAVLIWDEGDFIYAFQGNNTNNFWRYRISTNEWQIRANIPRGIGETNGHRLGYANGKIYAWYCRSSPEDPTYPTFNKYWNGDFWRLDLIVQKALV